MNGLFKALLGLGDASVDAYKNVRARFFVIIAGLFLLILFEWMLNYWGYLEVNAVIYFILLGLTVYLWSHPTVAIGMTTLEKVSEEKFAAYLAYVVLWLSIVSMFLATLPFGWYLSFREAFGLFLIGMVFLSAIGWMAFHGWFKTTLYKKIITRYAIIGFLVVVWILIPTSFKFWLTGMDFYGSAGTSETTRVFAKAKYSISIKEDQVSASVLQKVGKHLEKGGKLSDLSEKERGIWEKAERNNLPNKLSDIFSKNSWSASAEAKTDSSASINHVNKQLQLCWKKQERHAGNGKLQEYCSALTLLALECDGKKITLKAKNGNIGEQILVGDKIDDLEFRGSWTQIPKDYEGEWQLRFSPDFKTATGWQTNKGEKIKVFTWIKS
jgi:hypothetical protein